MEWITWGDTLCLGHDGIDGDHRKLIALINKMADAIINDALGHDHQDLLNDLIEFTLAHFAEEDRLMRAHDYPQAEAHREEHRMLVQSAFDFVSEHDAGTSLSVPQLRFLRSWLTRHIVTMDKELADFLAHHPAEVGA